MAYDYDYLVIGAGSGGVRSARMAASHGAKTAIIESSHLGGTCVNVGCVPKKLFVIGAHFHEWFEDAKGFGWQVNHPEFDWAVLLNNKNKEIERLNGIYGNLLEKAGVTLIDGQASFKDAHTVTVDGKDITADRILIAVGGWPVVPDFPGNEHVITSNQLFYLDKLPEKMIIVGGGYIAVEFAGIFNGLGVDVTLMYRGELFLRGFDEDIRHHLKEEMQARGVNILFNQNIKSIEKTNDLKATLLDGSTLEADCIAFATGRAPNTAELDLDSAGVKTNEKGAVTVNEHYQTSVENIYAVGDVTDRVNLTPVAIKEGHILADNLFNKQKRSMSYNNIATAVFSTPPIGTIGLTEEQAREQYDIEVFTSTFRPMIHTLSGRHSKTFMKMIVDKKTDKVLGLHMCGDDAGEIIQGFAVAINMGATKADFDATVGIHPTSAEEFVTMR